MSDTADNASRGSDDGRRNGLSRREEAQKVPSEEMRDYFVRRFVVWLDRTLAEDALPSGIAAEILGELEGEMDLADARSLEGHCDMQSLWSALTALVQEVRLQGRAFKELSGKVQSLGDLRSQTEAALRSHDEALREARRIAGEALRERGEREADAVREAERRGRGELVELLIDVRDRLRRGLGLARQHLERASGNPRPRWLVRLLGWRTRDPAFSTAATEALERGYTMALEGLEEHLGRLGVREIPAVGKLFDPRVMHAADVAEAGNLPEGTVLEVYRAGYWWGDEVLRAAQVKVARVPAKRGERNGSEENERERNHRRH